MLNRSGRESDLYCAFPLWAALLRSSKCPPCLEIFQLTNEEGVAKLDIIILQPNELNWRRQWTTATNCPEREAGRHHVPPTTGHTSQWRACPSKSNLNLVKSCQLAGNTQRETLCPEDKVSEIQCLGDYRSNNPNALINKKKKKAKEGVPVDQDISLKSHGKTSMVAHACNPSYLRGRDQEEHGLRSSHFKS
jgi:hypothetical protein